MSGMRPLSTVLHRTLQLAPSTRQTVQRIPSIPQRIAVRHVHPSPIPRRAPVPNQTASRPATSGLNGTSASSGPASANGGARNGGSGGGAKRPSPHAMWYREIVPAMISPLLISLTIFLSLSLLRLHLSHQLSLSEQQARIEMLEQELERLRRDGVRRSEREKRERERLLPVVVGKVLQRVGVIAGEQDHEGDLEGEGEVRLLV